MNIKFFKKDIVKGKAEKVGDIFYAEFFGGVRKFKVTSVHGDMFFAEFAK